MGEATVQSIGRAGSIWLLGALALVIVPHLLHMPFWLGAACLTAICWRLVRDMRGWALPGSTLRVLLTLAGIAAIIIQYGTVLGRDAGSALLVTMLCLKLVEMRTHRDAMVVVILGYFVVITGFLYNQSLLAGLYLLLVVLALTAALVALNHPRGTLRGSLSYLKLSAELLVQAIPMMVLLFVLFPRLSGSLWGIPGVEDSGSTGLDDEMSFGDIGHLAQSERPVVRVEFSGPVPPQGQLYWRGPVLWTTDGRQWRALGVGDWNRIGEGAPRFQPIGPKVRYTMTYEPATSRWLLPLDLPAAVPKAASVLPDFQLLATRPIEQMGRVSLDSFLGYRTAPLHEEARRYALQLPADGNPMALRLARGWAASGLRDEALVERALELFRRDNFYYTLDPGRYGDDPVDEFLFKGKRGYCEHYAAAFVYLMRAAGVPARVVTGYQGGEFNELGGFLLVRQSDAHAWAEVYLDDRGWVRVDPTAVIPKERVESVFRDARSERLSALMGTGTLGVVGKGWKFLRQGWDAVGYQWNVWVLGYDQKRQLSLLNQLGLGDSGWKRAIVALFVTLALLLSAVAAMMLLRGRPRPDPVSQAYHRFCLTVAQAGVVRAAGEGPLDFAGRAAAHLPSRANAIWEITRLYTAIRYSPNPPAGGVEKLIGAVKAFRR